MVTVLFILLTAAAVIIMTGVYSRTRHPVLYAFINTLAGCAALLAVREITGVSGAVSFPTAAISAVLGLPGAAVVAAVTMLM